MLYTVQEFIMRLLLNEARVIDYRIILLLLV